VTEIRCDGVSANENSRVVANELDKALDSVLIEGVFDRAAHVGVDFVRFAD